MNAPQKAFIYEDPHEAVTVNPATVASSPASTGGRWLRVFDAEKDGRELVAVKLRATHVVKTKQHDMPNGETVVAVREILCGDTARDRKLGPSLAGPERGCELVLLADKFAEFQMAAASFGDNPAIEALIEERAKRPNPFAQMICGDKITYRRVQLTFQDERPRFSG